MAASTYNSDTMTTKLLTVSNVANNAENNKLIETALYNQMRNKRIDGFVPSIVGTTVRDMNLKRHLLVRNLSDDMGQRWGVSAKHKTATYPVGSLHDNFDSSIGPLKNGLLTKRIQLDEDSVTYYDSHIDFVFSDPIPTGIDSSDNIMHVNFDKSNDLEYNAFKAVNSEYSRLTALGDDKYGLRVKDATSFNSNHALLTSHVVERDSTTQELSVGAAYPEIEGHNVSVVSANNDDVFYGSLKLEQGVIQTTITSSNLSTLTDANGNQLPSELIPQQFNALFTEEVRSTIGPGYTVTVSSNTVGGGFSLEDTSFTGFELDNSNLTSNVKFMSTLKDFSDVNAYVSITNGDMTLDDSSFSDYVEISAGEEKLSSSEATTGYLYINPTDRMARTIVPEGIENSERIPALRVTYSLDEGTEAGALDNKHKTTYNVEYTAECVLASTSDSVDNYSVEEPLNIGKSNNFLAVISEDSSELFSNTDVIFSATSEAVSKFADDKISLINILQKFKMSQENGSSIYYGDSTVKDALFYVTAENVDLKTLQATDMRVKMTAKQLSDITPIDPANKFVWKLLDDATSLISAKQDVAYSMFKSDDVEKILEGDNFNFTVKVVSSGITSNVSGSKIEVKLGYNCVRNGETVDNEVTLDASEFEKIELQEQIVNNILTLSAEDGINKIPNGFILKIVKNINSFKLRYKVPFGGYSNLMMETPTIYECDIYAYLEDANGVKVPDRFLSKLEVSSSFSSLLLGFADGSIEVPSTSPFLYGGKFGVKIIALAQSGPTGIKTRFENGTGFEVAKTTSMSKYDLFGLKSNLQRLKSDGEWEDVGTSKDFDVLYDIETELLYNDAVFTVNVDAVNYSDFGSDADTYYIELSNSEGTETFEVTAKIYESSQIPNISSEWSEYLSKTNGFFPTGGSEVVLSTRVTRLDLDASNPADQNAILLEILDTDLNVLFEFNTVINIAANFNIIKSANGAFKITEKLGDVSPINNTNSSYTVTVQETNVYYIVSTEPEYIKVVDGVEVQVVSNVSRGDKSTFRLIGDEVQCLPYNGYTGVYSDFAEVTPSNGVRVGDEKCRIIVIKFYRGIPNTLSTELSMTRTPTSIQMIIEKGDVTYVDLSSDLYSDSTHLVSDLRNLNDSNDFLGNIGLVINGQKSRFNSDITEKKVVISFGSYDVRVQNPRSSPPIDDKITVSTKDFYIKRFETLDIVASRVVVEANESYVLTYGVPDMKIYTVSQYVGDARNVSNWGSPVFSVSDADMRTGIKLGNNTLSNGAIYIQRTEPNVQAFDIYLNCPRPQAILEAISRLDVADVPYDPSVVTRKQRFFDINFSSEVKPFNSFNGLNDVSLTYNSAESYTGKRMSPNGTYKTFAIPTNQLLLKFCPGFGESPDQSLVIETVGPYNISDFPTHNNNKLLSTYQSQLLSFEYQQSTAIFTPQPQLFTESKNLKVNGIHAFSTGEYHLDMSPNQSVVMSVYGHNINYKTSNKIEITFVKYETAGVDYYNESILQLLKEIQIVPVKKYTSKIVVNEPSMSYDVAFALDKLLTSDSCSLGTFWSWTEDLTYVPAPVNISFVSLSGKGRELMLSFLAVNRNFPSNWWMFDTPDLLNYVSDDGSPILRITNSGKLIVSMMNANIIKLFPTPSLTSGEDSMLELFAGNVLEQNAL